MSNKQKVLTGAVQLLLTVIASIILGFEFGWKVGVSVGFIAWSLTPIQEG